MNKRYSNTKYYIKMANTFNKNSKSLRGLNEFTRNFIKSQIRMQSQ